MDGWFDGWTDVLRVRAASTSEKPLTHFAGGLVAAVLTVHLAIAHHVLRHANVVAAAELVVLAT